MKMSLTTRTALEPSAELMEWDTEFWQTRIGRGNCSSMDEWAKANTIGCMALLIPAADQDEIQRAEGRGFRFADIRVKLERNVGPEITIARPAVATDVEALAIIARTAFRGLTRFYADPGFDNERCDDLYEGWFRENAADPLVDILMVGDGAGPAAFVTVRIDDEEASIVLIAVADDRRGIGVGVNLTRAAVNHAHSLGIPRISVVTQGCNIPAQRAFQGAGFVTSAVDVWLHKWYG